MLKIIPKPKSPKVLFTFPLVWMETYHSSGNYYEYSENEFLKFKFHYNGNLVSILDDGSWITEYPEEDILNFFVTQVHSEDLMTWIKEEVSLEVISDSMAPDDERIEGLWKFTQKALIPDWFFETGFKDKYLECKVFSSTIRCLPYECWYSKAIKLDLSEVDDDKIYWMTIFLLKYQSICLPKYQKASKKQSEE